MARSQSQSSQREGGEVVRRQSPRKSVTGGSAPVLSGGYLQRHTSKNDLVKRLRNVVEQLQDPAVEPNSPDFPGLGSLSNTLVADQYINHRDKDVRLHTVLACMEIFAVYAPEPPFDAEDILKIFSQMIRQLANLSHCTSPASANFDLYTKILEDLAEVKIGIVLVELMRSLDPSGTLSQREMMDSDDEMDENDESALREEATEMLCELIKTIIHSVTWEHPAEVYTNAVDAVAACVDEFYQNTPIPILDEVLAPIGAGPTVWVTNPAAVEAAAAIAEQKKKNKKSGKKNAAPINIKMPPSQIQQQNRSYHVAAKVLQKCEDRVAQPVANLLNGLLNGDPKVVDMSNISSADAPPVPRGQDGRSSTADVWDIIFELHKVSSQALTTVIGNLAPLLENEDLDKRIRVTKLLGKLFCSSHSDMANNYRIVFSKWLRRTNDREAKLRSMIVKQIATFMQFKAHERELCEEATKHLIHVMKNDPEQTVRIDAIHAVCDLAHSEKSSGPLIVPDPQNRNGDNAGRGYGPVVSAKLLRAVADRVQSKNKDERKDAITGLAQIYYRHYACEKLKDIQRGGDDCDIAIIMDTLHDTCFFGQPSSATASKKRGKAAGRRRGAQRDFDEDEDEDMADSVSYDIDDKYKWIPSLIFKSGFFTDGKDSGMRDRVNQIIDDVILGPYKAVNENDSSGSRKKILTPTSRAVGFSMILDSCRHDDGSLNADVLLQLEGLLVQKSNLQTALKGYIEARSRVKECEAGSEEALTADAEAMEKLREVSNLSSPITGSSDHDDVLQSLHSARDKHIFRILATISSPNHTPSSRQRAFDDLPKRAKSLGNATAAWVKKLARRCAMGGFINEESIATCIQLAQECFQEGDLDCTRVLLTSARAALQMFNPLGANRESFGILVELYGECQSSHVKNKKQIDQAGIPSLLNQMLAIASPQLTLAPSGKKGKGKSSEVDDKYEDELQDMLLRMVTRDGSVEQAQYAVYTLSQLAKKDEDPSAREKEVFEPLLRSLTSPSRLTIDSKGGNSKRILQILAALKAIAECAPSTFSSTNGRGEKAIKFALESILLGRTANGDESGGSDDDSDEENESSDEEGDEESVSTSKSKRRSSQSRRKGTAKPSTSVAANRAKLAISLLTTHIRSSILASRQANWTDQNKDHIKSVFSVLEQILRDSGLPPSSRDRRECKSSSDRAVLRQSAALNIFRLCDPILQLEDQCLSNSCWHLLGDVLTDEEQSVREKVIREYSDLIAGYGKYFHGNSYATSLRLLSLTILCADPENNRNGAVASGNTAVVGKASDLVKARASVSIVTLRRTSDQLRAHCVAGGRESEERFDKLFKFQVMPECSLSFALHLLSFRSETPSKSSGVTNDTTIEEEESDAEDDLNTVARDSAKTKMLRKRLKWLLEPLVQSLGEGANNISFLLRIVDLLGNKWQPTDVTRNTAGRAEGDVDEDTADKTFDTISSLGISLDQTTSGYRSAADAKRAQDAQAKLKAACFEAREVLLKFVKKDINLQTYPGGIGFPMNLFEKKLPAAAASEKEIEAVASPFSAKDSLASPMSSIKKSSAIKSSAQRHAHFSPELESRHEFREDSEGGDDDNMGGGPFNMDDDDDEIMPTSVRASEASAKTTKTAASSRRKRSSYGSKASSAGDDLPLSNSPSEPRGAKNSFGGMSPIAQSASPASSTPSPASARSGAKRKQPQATSPAQTEASDLPSQSQSTLGSPESKAASAAASPPSAKKRKVKATPVKIKVSRSSTGTASSSAEKSTSTSKRPARRAKSRGQQKQQKAAASASKALVDDELDFDDGEDDGFDDAVPTASTKGKAKGKKRTATGGGRKITVSAKGSSKGKGKGGKNMSPSKKSKGLAKSTLQNKTRRRAKA